MILGKKTDKLDKSSKTDEKSVIIKKTTEKVLQTHRCVRSQGDANRRPIHLTISCKVSDFRE